MGREEERAQSLLDPELCPEPPTVTPQLRARTAESHVLAVIAGAEGVARGGALGGFVDCIVGVGVGVGTGSAAGAAAPIGANGPGIPAETFALHAESAASALASSASFAEIVARSLRRSI